MEKVNNNGILRHKFVKREALKMLILGPLFSIIYIVLSFISMSKWLAFFYVTVPFLVIFIIVGFIYAPILMLKRHNRTIKEISFDKPKIVFKVFPALWLKSKEIILNRDQFKVKDTIFNWYGKEKKKGVIVTLKNNEEYYLVSDFFDEYELIIKNMA